MSNLLESVLDSQQIMVDAAIKKAGYDKTIQAQIVSCQDATIGKYKCKFQDAVFYAYANSSDISYTNGSFVYILVPGNDMSKEKTILGTTKKLGINYISQAQGDEAYDIIGTNCVINDEKFYLDTKYQNYNYILYKAEEENNTFLDINSLNQYLKQSSSLVVGATFKTSISPQKQYRGHYGITYNLKFIDNTTNQEVTRSYTVDEDNMVDNPYRLTYPTRQYEIFEIDGQNFIEVESIQIFNKDFPDSQETNNEKLTSGDIEITNLEISGAVRMSQSEINGVAISFFTPLGTFFMGTDEEKDYKTITAQVRVKGKLASAAQNIPFYWGIENVGITPKSEYYNKYLGRGWKCLNESNIIDYKREFINPQSFKQIIEKQQENRYYFKNFEVYVFNENTEEAVLATSEDIKNKEGKIFCYFKPDVIEWVPGKDTYTLYKNDAVTKNNKIKVAILYEGSVITKEINIQNLGAETILSIESSDGTQFYYDIGHPTLTCKVKKKVRDSEEEVEQPWENYEYHWAYENNKGIFQELPQNITENEIYQECKKRYEDLLKEIRSGISFANASAQELKDYESTLKSYNYIQRVYNNKIYDVQINKITSFGIFKCTVYDKNNNIQLGTASITLKNTLEGEDLYSLVINNGSQIFQYNENGVAPNNKSLDNPQQIQGLSFTVYDNLGQPIDNEIILHDKKNCKIRWQFPIKDTLLIEEQEPKSQILDSTKCYHCYDDTLNLIYNIAKNYDIKKQRNQIKLTVNYKGMNLTAETNFTFAKQGQPGTNGTQFLVKIVPNTTMNNLPLWPMVTKIPIANGYQYRLNYILDDKDDITNKTIKDNETNESLIGTTPHQLFKAQLWHSGDLVWEGFSSDNSAIDGVTNPDVINWEVLKNKYSSSIYDESAFVIDDKNKGTIRCEGFDDITTTPFANIIKCSITWQGKTYYGTIPITIAWVSNNYYRVNLKDYTGFRYVMYASDGTMPQYDSSNPFEFICMEKINENWEDVSIIQGSHEVKYAASTVGNYYDIINNQKEEIASNLLEILSSEYYGVENKNQYKLRPASRYNGICVNEAVCCEYTQNNSIIGQISIPIHFLLNKYGLSQINEWDGNSIQINNDGGFILSPQVGAGKKESEGFTGVLMGQAKLPEKKTSQIGLLGYKQGERSFFLNSRNGSAIFGKAGKGQIVIDPSADRALLYSGNFWNNYNKDGDNDGLPENYGSSNQNHKGMLIDLTTPEIRFGSNNFYVNSEGHIHAGGGGDIAGWNIDDQKIYSKNSLITLHSEGKIYSGTHDTLNSNQIYGFYLSSDGLSIGQKVRIDNDGTMRLGPGATNKSGIHWIINGENNKRAYIAYGGEGHFSDAADDSGTIAKVYLGTDGISLGSRFSVDSLGQLTAYSGKIGGWQIYKGYLTDINNKIILNGNTGDLKGGEKSVQLSDNKTYNTEWSISNKGVATFNYLKASSAGEIGGWTIGSNYLKGGNLTLYKDGSIENKINNEIVWNITKNGLAHFKKVYGAVADGYTFVAGPATFYGGAASGNAVGSPGTAKFGGSTGFGGPVGLPSNGVTVGDKDLATYVKDLVVDRLTVNEGFTFLGKTVTWKEQAIVTGVTLDRKTSTVNSVIAGSTISGTVTYDAKKGYQFSGSVNVATAPMEVLNGQTVVKNFYKNFFLLTNDPKEYTPQK